MKSALIVVDVQQSFLKRPYWSDTDAPRFMERLQALIDRCTAQRVPVLQVFHVEEDEGPVEPVFPALGLRQNARRTAHRAGRGVLEVGPFGHVRRHRRRAEHGLLAA